MSSDERPSAFHGSSPLGSLLIHAGREERPSDEALARALAAVGAGAAVVAAAGSAVGAGVSAGTAAKSSIGLLSFGTVMKWLGMGALGGVVVAGVAHGVVPAESPRARLEPPAPVAPPSPPPVAAPVRSPAPEPALAPPAAAVDDAPPSPVSRVAPRPVDDALANAPLAAEVALVDTARAALANGRPALALDELSDYETAFRAPRLLPEVLFLRMEAHLAQGNQALARQTAERTLRLFPRAGQVLDGESVEKK